MTSNIFIDTVNLVARASTSGTALPNVRGKLFSEMVLNVRFFDGTGTIIPVDVASVIVEIKLASDPDGPALLMSSSPVVTGGGATTQYAFAWDYADCDALETALSGATAPVDMICAIQYALSGSMEQIDVAMSFENSYVRPQDQASDPVDAERWQWLKTHAPDAGGFAHDDTTRTLSVNGIAAEATARAAADTTLQTNITAEATARAAADALKQNASSLGADVASAVHAAAAKTTPVDADEIGISDSAASFGANKVTWANIKATLKTYLDTLYAALTHASRHKSGGADAIKIDELAAGTSGGTTLDATTATHGLMSSNDKTKLNGIANGANNYSLPVANSAALGGVKATVGGAGQFVTGINSDGNLAFDSVSRLRTVMLPGGPTNATVADLDATVFTDAYSDGPAQIILPLFADAFAHGGAVRVVAGRDYVDGNTFVSVYPAPSEQRGGIFLIGSQALYSLYSTGKGDYLELLPVSINGTNYWQVVQFDGLWQDRD